MLVYLFELDSVRNSEKEIKIGQQALFEEIVINGNQVALSFNQLTDSESFLQMIENEKTYPEIISLFRCGALKVSRFRKYRTASQYIQDAIDKCVAKDPNAFLFSGLPVKCTDIELLKVLKDALVYEEVYEKRKLVWKKERAGKLAKWFVTAIVYIVIFYVVEKGLDYLESYVLETTVNFRLNAILSGILDTICFGVLGSWISDKLQLVDVLQSFRNIVTGIRDVYRIRKAPKQMSYRRKNVLHNKNEK